MIIALLLTLTLAVSAKTPPLPQPRPEITVPIPVPRPEPPIEGDGPVWEVNRETPTARADKANEEAIAAPWANAQANEFLGKELVMRDRNGEPIATLPVGSELLMDRTKRFIETKSAMGINADHYYAVRVNEPPPGRSGFVLVKDYEALAVKNECDPQKKEPTEPISADPIPDPDELTKLLEEGGEKAQMATRHICGPQSKKDLQPMAETSHWEMKSEEDVDQFVCRFSNLKSFGSPYSKDLLRYIRTAANAAHRAPTEVICQSLLESRFEERAESNFEAMGILQTRAGAITDIFDKVSPGKDCNPRYQAMWNRFTRSLTGGLGVSPSVLGRREGKKFVVDRDLFMSKDPRVNNEAIAAIVGVIYSTLMRDRAEAAMFGKKTEDGSWDGGECPGIKETSIRPLYRRLPNSPTRASWMFFYSGPKDMEAKIKRICGKDSELSVEQVKRFLKITTPYADSISSCMKIGNFTHFGDEKVLADRIDPKKNPPCEARPGDTEFLQRSFDAVKAEANAAAAAKASAAVKKKKKKK